MVLFVMYRMMVFALISLYAVTVVTAEQNGDLLTVINNLQTRITSVESVVSKDGKAIGKIENDMILIKNKVDYVKSIIKDEAF